MTDVQTVQGVNYICMNTHTELALVVAASPCVINSVLLYKVIASLRALI